MRALQTIVAVCLLALYIQSSQGFTSGINAVVTNLAEHQASNGGFVTMRDSEPTLEATSQALFLASLFGLKDTLNLDGVAGFLQTVHNQDHGYGKFVGAPSDLDSVRDALLVHAHLGKPVENSAELVKFIHSLYHRETQMFANTAGGIGDLKATATALQCFATLNQLQSDAVLDKQDAIRKNLLSLLKTNAEKGTKYFSSITSDNYHAILVASFVGVDLSDAESFARYFQERQVTAVNSPYAGAFYADKDESDVTVEDIVHVSAALSVLQKAAGLKNNQLFDMIDTEAMVRFASSLPRNLKYAADAFHAIAYTPIFQQAFKINVLYDVVNSKFRPAGNKIVVGTQTKPQVSVRTHFGLPHSAVEVRYTVSHLPSGLKQTTKLSYNDESQTYVNDEFVDTTDRLGELTFSYEIRWAVANLGDDVVFKVVETKYVGYDISVVSQAEYNGLPVEVQGVVGVGATFNFDVRLGTVKQLKPALLSGDFDVVFAVLDSSRVVIHEEKFSAKGNEKPIAFKYALTSTNLPAGALIFAVGISNENGYHTQESVLYNLKSSVVVSDVSFDGVAAGVVPSFKVGDTVKVTMTPGVLNAGKVEGFQSQDFHGKEVTREFYMDVASAETNENLFSLMGRTNVTDGKSVYVFSLDITENFDAIGASNVITFRYTDAAGQVFPLQTVDAAGEASEEKLKYKVDTNLEVTELVNAPSDGVLEYGNQVKFSFKVKDTVSGKYITANSRKAGVYLALRHNQDKDAFTSTKVNAVQLFDEKTGEPTNFQVSWTVNPNAVKGKGVLELVAQSSDGKEVVLNNEKGQSWRVQVQIGGKLNFQTNSYSKKITDEETAFFVELELSCESRLLTGASLVATISQSSKAGKTVVAENVAVSHGEADGKYQLSWLLKPTEAVAGDYVVELFRQVDVRSGATPLYSVVVKYQPESGSFLPFSTEFLVLVTLGSAFVWTSFKKLDLEGNKKNKKVKAK
eukprot:TRINITY_DN9550_c0_g1_i1.p1 TRINITY_DN9550_c0_g1~~TRINITY_DN9550_c0_g1_i1.p1  ORF type:complete len:971 (+),score=279.65 TRINITY_DN9550_c0_g1_i1:71-2983(+)